MSSKTAATSSRWKRKRESSSLRPTIRMSNSWCCITPRSSSAIRPRRPSCGNTSKNSGPFWTSTAGRPVDKHWQAGHFPYNRRTMLETAIEAASEAGKLLRRNFGSTLQVNLATPHDIKLEIDEQAQRVITKVILAEFPDHCILGEEAVTGNPNAEVRWVVDPLDGTVNYFYNIPHYAVSIAAQERKGGDQD